MVNRIGDLETGEDPRYEAREQRVQRITWVIMGLVVAAALAGLFGSGPLARASATARGLEVDYERFARVDAPGEVRARVGPGVPAQLWLSRQVVEDFDVEKVTPEPDSITPEGDRLVYRYASVGPAEVVFELRPRRAGPKTLRLGVVGGGEAELSQLVYP